MEFIFKNSKCNHVRLPILKKVYFPACPLHPIGM